MQTTPTASRLNRLDETRGRSVGGVDKNDIRWIAARCVHREKDDRFFEELWQGMHRSAFEKEQISGSEFRGGAFILEPEGSAAREYVKIFVARGVIVRRRGLIDSKDARAGRFTIGKIVIEEQRSGCLGEGGRDLCDVKPAGVSSSLVHGIFSGFAGDRFRSKLS